MEATTTEGLRPPVEMPYDLDENFSAKVLREAKFLRLDESAFLPTAFDACTKVCLTHAIHVGHVFCVLCMLHVSDMVHWALGTGSNKQ
jgi:hypothetical protein